MMTAEEATRLPRAGSVWESRGTGERVTVRFVGRDLVGGWYWVRVGRPRVVGVFGNVTVRDTLEMTLSGFHRVYREAL